jgi:hypothetical protein
MVQPPKEVLASAPEVKEGEYKCKYYTDEQWKSDLLTQAYNGFLPEHRDDMVMTWIHESGLDPNIVSPPNTNGTRDHGFCQLNSQYHYKFIGTDAYNDPVQQVDYCLSVYKDAVKKGRALGKVWYGWASRLKHKNKYTCNKV